MLKSDAGLLRSALHRWAHARAHEAAVRQTMLRAVQRMAHNSLREFWDCFADGVPPPPPSY